jgi:hypothetical protein
MSASNDKMNLKFVQNVQTKSTDTSILVNIQIVQIVFTGHSLVCNDWTEDVDPDSLAQSAAPRGAVDVLGAAY